MVGVVGTVYRRSTNIDSVTIISFVMEKLMEVIILQFASVVPQLNLVVKLVNCHVVSLRHAYIVEGGVMRRRLTSDKLGCNIDM